MWRVKHCLRGTTLIETLVMMVVAGIVFLSVMDGMTLFTRLQLRRAKELSEAGARRDGYYRVAALVAEADSVGATDPERVELYYMGRQTELACCDSMVICRRGGFCDTLLYGVCMLFLGTYDLQPDTLEIAFETGFTAKFPVKLTEYEQYQLSLEEIERDYGYEE